MRIPATSTSRKLLRLELERRKRGWRLTDLGHFARMSPADISKIESGRQMPFPAHIERLCSVLGIRPDELLEEIR